MLPEKDYPILWRMRANSLPQNEVGVQDYARAPTRINFKKGIEI